MKASTPFASRRLWPSLAVAALSVLVACGGGGDEGYGNGHAYSIGGGVSGLTASGMTLKNGALTLSIAAGANRFSFPATYGQGQSYDVMVVTQPIGQMCEVDSASASGAVPSADVTDIHVTCMSDEVSNGYMRMSDAEEAMMTAEPAAPNASMPYETEKVEGLVPWQAGAAAVRQSNRSLATAADVSGGTISGMAQYQRVFPSDPASCYNGNGRCGLDFSAGAVTTRPMRFVAIDLVDATSGTSVLASTTTDASGSYQFTNVAPGSNVVVRVAARTVQPGWSFSVVDNTAANARYTLPSDAVAAALGQIMTVNLLAGIGYTADGTANDSGRKSAPFSLIDDLVSFSQAVIGADPSIVLPPLAVNWSVNNIASAGDPAVGQIGTSNYNGTALSILGKADDDTDEFDVAVVGHEYGHFLQRVLSSTDNPGGTHSSADINDYSLAYGEGFGTAIGAALAGVTHYVDTSGAMSASGSATPMNVLPSSFRTPRAVGAFSERAVAYAQYKLIGQYGMAPFFAAFRDMRNQAYSSTLAGFAGSYASANPNLTGSLRAILAEIAVNGIDPWGSDFSDARLTRQGTDPTISADTSQLLADYSRLYLTLPVNTPTAANFTNAFKYGTCAGNGLGFWARFKANVVQGRSYAVAVNGLAGQTVFFYVRGGQNNNYLYGDSSGQFVAASTETVSIKFRADAAQVMSPDVPVTVTLTEQ